MARSIGVVRQVVGEVFAVGVDGSRRLLAEGDRVFAGEQLVTGPAGAVAVALANGQELVLGRDSSMALNNALLAGNPGPDQAADGAPAAPSQQDLADVEKLQAAIEAGVDPTEAAEATAAGPGSGAGAGNAGGGHSFVLLDATAGSVDPSIGFPTGPIGFIPELREPETAIPAEEEPAPEPVNGVPVAQRDSRAAAEGENGLQGNVLDNDDPGPDLPLQFVSWQIGDSSVSSLQVNSPYGVVSLNADGSYSFVLANGRPELERLSEGESVELSFGYTIQDSNGDRSVTTLTITITGSNDGPTVEASFPQSEGGLAQVFEHGLPNGSSASDGSTVVNGSFSVGDPDGLDDLKNLSVGSLTLDLTSSTFASLVGQSFAAAHGTVLITGYSNGTYSFSYTLTEATTDAAGPETDGFLINVGDGLANASTSVSIEIIDDLPQANPDSGSLTENATPASLAGNVLGNDVGGADQPKAFTSWNGVAGATAGENGSLLVNTPYGLVTLNADGSYSFALANGSAAVEALDQGEQVTLQYAYSMRDADGDPSSSTLTLTILGSNDVPTVEVSSPNGEGGLAQVFERGLPSGSSAGDGSTLVTGSFSVGDSDGLDNLKSLSVGSLTLDLTSSTFASLVGQSFAAAHGTVLITGYSNGTYSFSYTLTEATTDAAGPETDGFLINVGDGLANASTSVSIEIIDDLPQANPDSGSLTENATPASLAGNVLGNDVGGADQPKAFTNWNGVAGATAGENGSLLVNTPYGLVTLNADGSYSFVLANGSAAVEALDQGEQVTLQYAYSMRDADGDPSTSTLTLTILGSNDVPTVEVSSPNGEGGLAQVFERGLPSGSSAGDGSTLVTGSFSVGDSDGLDNLKSLNVGSLILDLTTSGFASLVGQSFAAAHGTVLITGYSNGTYSFSYTLTEATTDAAGPETDGFLITVSDGLANSSANVSIAIIDDLPQAKADSAAVSEGGSVSGNLVTGTGLGSVADVFGADGRPTPATGVVGVRAGGDTSTPASGGVGLAITTAFGTFVLHADGSYSYTSHPDSLAQAGAVDTFTYSIVDADGDLSTTTLTIDIANLTVVGSVQAGSDDEVREAALGFGSQPASNDEIASGTLVASGGSGPYSFSLGVGAGTGQYGQLVVDSNGHYTYTLLSAPKVNPGDNGNNLQFTETFTFVVTDANGNTGTGILTVDIIDDVPDISVRGLDGLDLQVDETTLGVTDSTNFAGAFMSVFGADGAAASNAISYDLDVKAPGVDSGVRDTETGNSILLFKEGADIVGRVAGGGQLAFRLSVAADGTVTLEQLRAILHTPNTGPDQVTGQAADGLVTLTATITDGDGDRDSATLDLGKVISVRDDAPCIDPHVTVCLDDDALPYGNPGGVGDDSPDSHNTSGVIAHDFGADGPGEIELQDSGAPQGFTYVEVHGGLLIKQGDVTVITITLDKYTGAYTVTQNAPILHAYGDDENNLTFEVEYKITDGDGDRADGSLYIKVDDDSPKVSSYLAQAGSLDVDETWLGQAVSTSFAGLFSGGHGADGPGSSQYSLGVSSTGADSGLDDSETGGDILLYTLGDDVVGRVGGEDGEIAFRVSVGQDGQVTLEQLRAILHVPDSGPNQATSLAVADLVKLTLTLTDRDGDSASASVGLGTAISFRDDAPKVSANEAVQLDDDALLGGNPGGTDDVDPDADNLTGTLGHSFGSDGAGSISLLDTGAPSGFSYEKSGDNLLIKQGGITVITLTLNPTTGTYSVSQDAAIQHASGGNENDVSFTVGYQVTDKDGDSINGSLTIHVDDDTPTVTTNYAVQLDDDALSGGNPGGTGDVDPDRSHLTGTLGHRFGADGAGSISLLETGAPSGFSYEKSGDNLLIKQGGLTVITLTLNWATGAYSVIHDRPIMHLAGEDENDLSFTIGYKVTDADGDSTTGSLTIDVDDDTPQAHADSGGLTENGTPSSLSGNVLDNDAGGADAPKAFTSWNGIAGATPGDNGSLQVNTPYGLVTLNADGSYSFALANGSAAVEALDQGEQVTLQYAYSMHDADGDPGNSTLTITITGGNDTPTVEVSSPDAQGNLAQVFERGLPNGSSAGDGSTVATGSFGVGDTDGLDDLKSLSVGSLTLDLTTNSFASLVGQSFSTAHGTVLITGYSNGTYSFSYTLTEATTDAAGPETDGFLVTVGDGLANASAAVSIAIIDDLPQAKADSASVGEGGSVGGNVVTGTGLGSVADVFGADGRPTPVTGVVGVRAGGDTSTPASGGVGVPIDTGLGTLVLNADGSYSYTSHPDSVAPAGAVDTFTYSIVDADGDISTTTLTIDIANVTVVGSVQAGSDDEVREAALSFGSQPASNDEVASGTLVGSGGNGPYSFGLASGAGTGQYGQLVVNSNGSYSYSLTAAPKVNPGDNGNNLQFTETFTFQVTDANGNSGTGTLTVDIVDDVPSITVQDLGSLGVQVDETTLANNASASFAAAFAPVFGADGAALVNGITYGLDVKSPGVDSGLRDTATGNSILLFKEGADIVGRVNGGGLVAFRLSVGADGTVTLDQQRAIVHSPESGPDQAASLGSADLISLTATLTDGDGDKDSASLDLGNAISFRDAAPSVTSNTLVRLDDDALPGGIPSGSGDDADSVSTSGSVGFSYGADGPGSVQWLTTGNPTGFTYEKSGSTLLIKQGSTTVLNVTLDIASGAYNVTQVAPIQHELGGQENDQLFDLTYQVTDKDGDTTNGTLQIKVDDDTPQARNDAADVAEGSSQDFNVVFVLDFSGSIDNAELDVMLDAVRNAGQTLFDNTDGDVRIRLVGFSDTAGSYPVVTDAASFTNLVNSLNPLEGGSRPFNSSTDFTAAIQETLTAYTPIPGWSNQVFFISDGNPNEQTGPGGASLTTAVASQWNTFVDNNGISVTTIGVGNGINTDRLQDVDVDGTGSPIMVNAFDDLIDTLASQIVGGVVSGNVLLGSNSAAGGGDDDAYGADGAGRILSIQIGTTTYTWDGASTISLSGGGSIAGSQLNNVATAGGGKLSFNFTNGSWTYVAPQNVVADTSENFLYSIVDKDGDPSSATLTVRIEDAAPVTGKVDEDELPGGITDSDAQTTVVTGNLAELLVGTPASAQFSVVATPMAMPSLTSDGVAVTYSRVGNTLVAKAGADTVFTLQVESNGNYTFTLTGPLDHPGATGNDNEVLTLNLTGALQASNGVSNLLLAGDLLIQVEDDIPAILATSNLVYSNSNNPAGAAGTFLYGIGADTRGSGPYSASDSDFTPISLSGTVGGTAISSQSVTWVSESATSATFDISFRYAPNPANTGTLEEASGTLLFNKVNGTYSVSLDEPIQGFTIFKTSTSLSITGYEVNSTVPDNTQPMVSVVELDNDFFVQYTSAAEPGGGTGSNNLLAGTSNVTTFTNGELFTQAASWVSVSNSANGVAGDTLGKGEVLDLNFYTSNPKGTLGIEPSARAAGMFLKFDGVNGEDLVVVLKLIGAGGAKTTRALSVSSSDIMIANSAALAAYGIILDNNDGAIVIEGNDFNAPGENWQIYGAQILTSVESITTSSAINFTSAMGSGGASDVSSGTSFGSSATDNDVLKVSDVGFITAESNTLDTELDFQVGIKDADGDAAASQVLHVTMEAGSTFVGTTGNDVIQATSGNDNLSGMGGNDVLVGGLGNDVLDGGTGIDTASYQGASAGVTVNLSLLGGQNTLGAGTDSLIGIENLIGSGLNDTLIGNGGDNLLAGNGGSDRLTGGAGADTFKWLPGDSGVTTIVDFTKGVDKLDLSQLLTGEHSNLGSLDDYLTMAFGANTTITVDSNSSAMPGGTGQSIVLEGVNLQAAYSAPDAASVITQMLDDGTLKADV